MRISSPAFEHEGTIPQRHTCEGDDLSPPLSWTDVPEGTGTLALICDDPDAPMGTWVHWVVFNIPPDAGGFEEAVAPDAEPAGGVVQGRNSWKRTGYGGPCPPPGKPHRYFFKLYALDGSLDLDASATKADLEAAMKGHVLADAELMGTYQR
ncbi:MAG: YbhB/YbcL family Raf kinase inhibitor-like protein [Candidatus Eisenbacteria bacterium]|nr:YbhB/YbcL family Raf kinase inhibitor-like protein [Candidatus Eisenbacteria bacterium]